MNKYVRFSLLLQPTKAHPVERRKKDGGHECACHLFVHMKNMSENDKKNSARHGRK
jgi:hypothetical protein